MARRRPRTAAIFDLDRTILSGASGPVFSEALREVGVLPGRRNPLEGVLFGIFNLVGENWPTMMLTRQGARAARGWSIEAVARAGEIAAPTLLDHVLPYAATLLDEHRQAGRHLVLATTTPHDLIAAFADRLGMDTVVATHYGRDDDHYDGTIDGEFVWGRGKARAVTAWAEDAGVDLSGSFAYSDSYYDQPLLSIVGHPHVVNPDPRLAVIAPLRRWPVLWFDVPPDVPKLGGLLEPQVALLRLVRPELFPYVRFRILGVENIPVTGPAILVANHRSYFDPVAIGIALSKQGRPVRFLGKKEVFDAPVVGPIAKAMGGIRVDRGTGSDAPLAAAEEVLAAGELVAMMPQGTIPRGREFFNPKLVARWGAARLAHASGAPVVPIGLWGTERVWPRSARMPAVHNVLDPPTVTIRVGRPVELRNDSLAADSERMMDAISALLPPEARRRREPTSEELAATVPPGRRLEDVEDEADRRPGSD